MTQEIFEELFSRCGPGYHCADLYQYSVLFTFINDQTCWVGITLYNPVPLSLKLNTHQERRESLLFFAVTTRNAELTDSCYFLNIHRGIPSVIQYLLYIFVRFVLYLHKYADTNVWHELLCYCCINKRQYWRLWMCYLQIFLPLDRLCFCSGSSKRICHQTLTLR